MISFLEIGLVFETKSESKIDNQTDRLDVQIPPVFYRTLSPSGPLPCSLQKLPSSVTQQGKGTDDHLLPLGDWLLQVTSGEVTTGHREVIWGLREVIWDLGSHGPLGASWSSFGGSWRSFGALGTSVGASRRSFGACGRGS